MMSAEDAFFVTDAPDSNLWQTPAFALEPRLPVCSRPQPPKIPPFSFRFYEAEPEALDRSRFHLRHKLKGTTPAQNHLWVKTVRSVEVRLAVPKPFESAFSSAQHTFGNRLLGFPCALHRPRPSTLVHKTKPLRFFLGTDYFLAESFQITSDGESPSQDEPHETSTDAGVLNPA